MPETTPLIKAALNLRVGAGFDVYDKNEFRRHISADADDCLLGFSLFFVDSVISNYN